MPNVFFGDCLDICSASYFEGADPAIKHPLNDYAVNEEAMKVSFRSGSRPYENEEGKEYKVEVLSHGCEALVDPYRSIELKYHEGRWKARGIGPLNQAVILPFEKAGTGGGRTFVETRERTLRGGVRPTSQQCLLSRSISAIEFMLTCANTMTHND